MPRRGRGAATPPRSGPAPEAMNWLFDSNVICKPTETHGALPGSKWSKYAAAQAPSSPPNWPTWTLSKDEYHGFNVSVAHVWAEQERSLDRTGQPMPVETATSPRQPGGTV